MPTRITAIGDSITLGVTSSYWSYKLMALLAAGVTPPLATSTYTPFSSGSGGLITAGTDWEFYNAGIGGNTTAQMLARFDTDVLGHPTDFCIIMGGINDYAASVPAATAVASIEAMCDKCDLAGVTVVLCTTTPYTAGTAGQKTAVDDGNALIAALAASRGYALVDTFAAMEYPDGSDNSPWQSDGIHPTAEGHTVIASAHDPTIYGGGTVAKFETGLVFDLRVLSDGTIRDEVGKGFATVGGTLGGALATVRPYAGGSGYEALFNGTGVTFPSTGMSGTEGTIIIVADLPADFTGTRYKWSWQNTTNDRIMAYSYTSGQVGGMQYGGTLKYDQNTHPSSGSHVQAIRWKNTTTIKSYRDGVAGSRSDVQGGVPTGLPATFAIGAQTGAGANPWGGYISRIIGWNYALTDDDLLTFSLDARFGPGRSVEEVYALLDTEVAAIDAIVDAIKLQTDKLTFDGSNRVASDVKVIANDAITAAVIATNAIDADAVADDAINSGALASSAVTEIAGGVRTELATELARIDAATSTRATPAQVAAELGTYDAPTKAELDAAVAPLATAVNLATVDTVVDAIKLKTDNLPSDPADQSAVEAAITAATSPLATAANLATVDTVADSILVVAQNILRWFTNKRTVTDSQQVLYADDSTTPVYTQDLTDNGTEVTRGKAT